MIRFDRVAKLLLEAHNKVGDASWGKAGMILATGENKGMFENYVPFIVFAGVFKHEFEKLFMKLKDKKSKWSSLQKEAKESALKTLKKEYKKIKSKAGGDVRMTDENKRQIRSTLAFSVIFKRWFTNNKIL